MDQTLAHRSTPMSGRAAVLFPIVALLVGGLVPPFVAAMGEGYTKLLALPAAILLAFLLYFSRTSLLLLIVVARASTELLFDASRFSVGGNQIGVGGLLNGFAILIALLMIFEARKPLPKQVLTMWAPFLIMAFFGIVVTPNRSEGIRLFLQLVSNAAIFVGAYYYVRSIEDFKKVVVLIIVSSVPPSIYGVYQQLTGNLDFYADAGYRLKSTFSHPNVYAFYLTFVISLVLYVLKSSTFRAATIVRLGMVGYMLLLIGLLLLTRTRSAWAACFFMFVAYSLFFERRFMVYIVVLGIAALFVPGVGDRLLDLTQNTGQLSTTSNLNSFSWRLEVWKSGLGYMSKGSYLLGNGLESFRFLAATFWRDSGGFEIAAHNVYVQLFFELGAAGLASFVWLYARTCWLLKPMLRINKLSAFVLLTLIVEYLVNCMSDNMLHYLSFNWYVAFVLGAGVAVCKLPASRVGVKPPITTAYV